eukprot:216922-Pleurochrysis_carterae.AAC.5
MVRPLLLELVGTSWPCPSRSSLSASPSFAGVMNSSKHSRGMGILTSIILRHVRRVGGLIVLRSAARSESKTQHIGTTVVGPGPVDARAGRPRPVAEAAAAPRLAALAWARCCGVYSPTFPPRGKRGGSNLSRAQRRLNEKGGK